MARPLLDDFDATGMNIDEDSLRNLVTAQTRNMFTGIMDLRTKRIYFAPLGPPQDKAHDHYGTKAPQHLDSFPQMVNGRVVDPIIHDTTLTSHHQLADIVIDTLQNGASHDDFCGFALRFEGDKQVKLAPTSRTLNPGYNGQIEESILKAILVYLRPKLYLLGFDLQIAPARTNPDAAQRARGGAVIPGNLFQSLKTLKKVQ